MHHYVYCVENLIDGMFYVGKHSTENLNDGYMGSGKLITRAIAKHGLENFRKFIIAELDSQEKAFEFEKFLVTEEFICNENTYNLIPGGWGGSRKGHHQMSVLNRMIISERAKRLHAEGFYLGKLIKCDWSGRKHRPETREKMRSSHVGKHDGEKNSQFGSCWVSHSELKKSQKVNKREVEGYLAEGWVKGRKMKW